MKKSLLITSYFPPLTGGISKSLYNFSKQFPNDKIVVLTDQNYNLKGKLKVIIKKLFLKSKILWPKWLPLLLHAYKTVKSENIELIQIGQIIPLGYFALLIKKIQKIPYIVYVYGQDLIISRDSIRKSKLAIKILNNADGIIANSKYTKDQVVGMGVKNKIEIAYPCPQLKLKKISNEELKRFKDLKHYNNKKILLSVGNLVKRKGHDNVIKAVKEIVKTEKDLRYIIVGNGPEKSNLVKMVNELNLSDFVEFQSEVSDYELSLYYEISNIFIMASRILNNDKGEPVDVEGFGMVFLEANLYGKPVIGGNNGGQVDAIENEKSGLLVDTNKVSEIKTVIVDLLGNEQKRVTMGEYGRQRVLDQFTWEKQTKKIIDLISNL